MMWMRLSTACEAALTRAKLQKLDSRAEHGCGKTLRGNKEAFCWICHGGDVTYVHS